MLGPRFDSKNSERILMDASRSLHSDTCWVRDSQSRASTSSATRAECPPRCGRNDDCAVTQPLRVGWNGTSQCPRNYHRIIPGGIEAPLPYPAVSVVPVSIRYPLFPWFR